MFVSTGLGASMRFGHYRKGHWICLVWCLLAYLLLPLNAKSADIDYSGLPPRSQEYLPILLEQSSVFWPELVWVSVLAAQIDTETCASPTSKMCWSPLARLKTSREEGFGLGQITRAWDAKGNIRFDALEELKQKHQEALEGWSWLNVSNALFQIRGVVLKNRDNFRAVDFADTLLDQFAFMDAAYNGGLGGVLSERRICQRTSGCIPDLWFGNVENTSNKAKVAADGYGQGFFYINRNHVKQTVPGIDDGFPKSRRIKYQKAGLP